LASYSNINIHSTYTKNRHGYNDQDERLSLRQPAFYFCQLKVISADIADIWSPAPMLHILYLTDRCVRVLEDTTTK